MDRLTERELYDGQVCFTKCEQTNCPDKCSYCDIPKEAVNKLREYENLEENGLLIRIPCKIGDVIYKVPSQSDYGINIVNRQKDNNRIFCQKVYEISICRNGSYYLKTCDGLDGVVSELFGETWFLSEEEAENKLKELEEFWNKAFSENNSS